MTVLYQKRKKGKLQKGEDKNKKKEE